MWPYTENENTWLRNNRAPLNHSVDESWPTPEQVEFHRHNAQVIRAEAVADAARLVLPFICSIFRKIRSLPAKSGRTRSSRAQLPDGSVRHPAGFDGRTNKLA